MNTFNIRKFLPAIYMITASCSIALSSFFAKLCMLYGLSQPLTVLARFAIPLIILIAYFINIEYKPNFSRFNICSQIIRAFALTSSQFLLFYAIKNLPLSEAMILYSTGPIFIFLYDLISGKKAALKTIISLGLGVIGIILMLKHETSIMNKYIWSGLLSGLALSISQTLLHKSSNKIHHFDIMFYVYLFSVLISLTPLTILGWNSVMIIKKWSYFSILCLLFTGIFSLGNQYFRGKAYSMVTMTSYLSPFIYFSILISVLCDSIYFHSILNINTWLGGMLIILGTYYTSKNLRT